MVGPSDQLSPTVSWAEPQYCQQCVHSAIRETMWRQHYVVGMVPVHRASGFASCCKPPIHHGCCASSFSLPPARNGLHVFTKVNKLMLGHGSSLLPGFASRGARMAHTTGCLLSMLLSFTLTTLSVWVDVKGLCWVRGLLLNSVRPSETTRRLGLFLLILVSGP